MSKIGLMGGTFDPIHNGHTALAEVAYQQLNLDEIWFMPSGISYLKAGTGVLDARHRANMVELAIKGINFFHFCDVEMKRAGNTYTVDTLLELTKNYPEHRFYFLMGADSFMYFPNWKDAKLIASLCTIVVAVRDQVKMALLEEQKSVLEEKYGSEIKLLNFPKMDIASSDIRHAIASGELSKVEELVAKDVLLYIGENKLYTEVEG